MCFTSGNIREEVAMDSETINNQEINIRNGKTWRKTCFEWVKYITIEPTMWLYMMAYMVTSVVEQAFFVHKACTVDHGLPINVCDKIKDNETLNAEVQLTVSEFHQWNNIAGHVVPIICALFFGNWSDQRGRKLPLILGLLGKLVYSGMVVVNTLIDTWNLNMIVYTASLPMGVLGGDVAIFASCFSYISDISSLHQRTLRITILDVVYLSTMPTGIAIGSYLFNDVVHKSYTIMFIINTSLLVLAIIYSVLRLKWRTSDRQTPFTGTNVLADFFDKKHVIATAKTLTKSRRNYGTCHLWILLLAMMLYTFQRDEKPMSFLYTQLMYKWDVTTFSQFRTFQSAIFVIAMLIGVPIMSKWLGLKDTLIVAIGALSHAAGRVLFAVADEPRLFYIGAAIAALGPTVAPVLRSMTSKLVPVEERGKVFAMLSVCDNAVPLFSGVLYSQLYNATIKTAPSSIYWLTFATQIAVLLLILIIHFSTKSGKDEDSSIDNDSDCPSISSHIETRKKAESPTIC